MNVKKNNTNALDVLSQSSACLLAVFPGGCGGVAGGVTGSVLGGHTATITTRRRQERNDTKS